MLFGVVLASCGGFAVAIPASAWASSEMLVNESFTGSSMSDSNWSVPSAPNGANVACLTAGTSTTEKPVPGCSSTPIDQSGSGALQLTPDETGLEGGLAYGLSVPTTDGIDATFDAYQYGNPDGNDADGIGFFLAAANPADPQPPAAIGSGGGDLGYSAEGNSPGMTDGYLGIGLDVFGNYTNPTFEGTGCTDPAWDTGAFPNNVSVRGPGNGTVGYCMLTSTEATGGLPGDDTLDGGPDASRSSSAVPVEVVINPSSSPVTAATSGVTVAADSYEVVFKPLGAASWQTLSGGLPNARGYGIPAGWLDPSGIPYQLTFGWVGSTGGDLEIHDVNDVQSATVSGIPATLTTTVTDNAGGAPPSGSTIDYQTTVANEALSVSM